MSIEAWAVQVTTPKGTEMYMKADCTFTFDLRKAIFFPNEQAAERYIKWPGSYDARRQHTNQIKHHLQVRFPDFKFKMVNVTLSVIGVPNGLFDHIASRPDLVVFGNLAFTPNHFTADRLRRLQNRRKISVPI